MLDFIKKHFLCLGIGIGIGYCLHFWPILCNCAGKCPVAGGEKTACACDGCACDVCKCDDGGCNCGACLVK